MTNPLPNTADLKRECMEYLNNCAFEHPSGHQGKLAARFVLKTISGERIGLMFEKDDKTKPNLWVERRYVGELLKGDIEFSLYLGRTLFRATGMDGKQNYGRHAALKSMRDLAHADLIRFTIDQHGQIGTIIEALKSN